ILTGGNRSLRELAADGLVPLPLDELIPLQVALASGTGGAPADPDIARRARQSLKQLAVRVLAPYLEREAGPEVLGFFALEVGHPLIVETLLRRRDVPRAILVEMARRLPGDLQEILLLRQDAILDEPAILDALAANPGITPYTQRRILEYRQHLLPQQKSAAALREDREAPPEISDEDLARAIEEVRVVAVEGEIEEHTGLSEGQIRMLPIPARLRLTRNASRVLRGILLRDPNTQVAVSVLQNNSMSDQELEQVARSRSVSDDVLEAIARNRQWIGRYAIAKALTLNPRTPVAASVRLMPKFTVRDLREISRDKNIPDAVRSTAMRLYTAKSK
nr:hypothetical protein [Acidobacteriota bacterium]